MTPQAKATIQRIVAYLVGALLIGIVTATISNSTRITVVENEIKNIISSQGDIKQTLETNRTENNDAHREILNEVKAQRK